MPVVKAQRLATLGDAECLYTRVALPAEGDSGVGNEPKRHTSACQLCFDITMQHLDAERPYQRAGAPVGRSSL